MRLLLLVVAWHYQLVYLLAERSPQEGDDLCTGAVIARRKGCLAHARSYAVHVAPRYRFIRPFWHIGERQEEHPRAREALALRLSVAVDHRRSLRTGADAVRAEGRLRQAGDDAGARRPADRLGIIRTLVYIREGHQAVHHGGTPTRQRKVTIWARVQGWFGAKRLLPTPPVIPFSAAHLTAS